MTIILLDIIARVSKFHWPIQAQMSIKRNKVAVIDFKNEKTSVISKAQGDALDKFLTMLDDPDDWYSYYSIKILN